MRYLPLLNVAFQKTLFLKHILLRLRWTGLQPRLSNCRLTCAKERFLLQGHSLTLFEGVIIMRRTQSFEDPNHRGNLSFHISHIFSLCTNRRRRLLRSARWRQGPITEKQNQLLSKRWLKNDEFQDPIANQKTTDQIARMTKGEAANILTRLKHGAMVIILSIFQPHY